MVFILVIIARIIQLHHKAHRLSAELTLQIVTPGDVLWNEPIRLSSEYGRIPNMPVVFRRYQKSEFNSRRLLLVIVHSCFSIESKPLNSNVENRGIPQFKGTFDQNALTSLLHGYTTHTNLQTNTESNTLFLKGVKTLWNNPITL